MDLKKKEEEDKVQRELKDKKMWESASLQLVRGDKHRAGLAHT